MNMNMRNLQMLGSLIVALNVTWVNCSAAESPAATKPNIVFILTDQQAPRILSSDGNPHIKTPNMDALAARGVSFAKSYCTYPLCCPSRASLFSSRVPHELQIYTNGNADIAKKGVPTMGEMFQAAGYRTAYAGKWHLGASLPAANKKPEDRRIIGFETLSIPGEVEKKFPRHQPPPDVTPGLYCDLNIGEAAAGFIAQPHEKPFLLVVSVFNPHDICYASRDDNFHELEHLLPADLSKLPPARPNVQDTEALPSAYTSFRRGRANWTDERWGKHLWVYNRLLEVADTAIGRVLTALEKAGLNENTLVVFTSDHGEMMGAHQLIGKGALYDEAAGVPLIVALPGGQGKVDRQHLVSGLDVMPTLLDYAGIKAPASLEGKSLKPVLEEKPVAWRDFVAAETDGSYEGRMIRTARYKYVVFGSGDHREQFFDMERDPLELKNLINEASLAGEVQRHRDLLKQWRLDTKDDNFGKGLLAEEAKKAVAEKNAKAKAATDGKTPGKKSAEQEPAQ